jgi:hypothetical protein
MDKIVEKLQSLGLSEDDLNEVKKSFDEAVETRVKAETDQISEKAEKYIAMRVDELAKAKTAELETLSEKYLEIKTNTIAKNASLKLNEKTAEVEKACEDYINEYFEKAFAEKYEKELALMEESILSQLDKYLDYAITENITPDLIKTTAVNETFAPIIKGIQNLFEEQYVPLNVSGKKKIKEAQAHVAELEETLKQQIQENMALTDRTEKYAKRALIAEKVADLSAADRANVRKFFAEKSFATTKSDIDSYCAVLKESAKKIQEAKEQAIRESKVEMKEPRSLVTERTNSRPRPRTAVKSYTEDNTPDLVTERIKTYKQSRKLDEASDDYLTSVAKYVELD